METTKPAMTSAERAMEAATQVAQALEDYGYFYEDQVPDAIREVAPLIAAALEAERRAAGEEAARIAEQHQEHMDFAPVQDHRPEWAGETYRCNVAEAIRRAFSVDAGEDKP